MPKPNHSLAIPIDLPTLREHHTAIVKARNAEQTSPTRQQKLLTQPEYRFAEYMASLGAQRVNRNQATLTLQFLLNDKELVWRDVDTLMNRKGFKEYLKIVRERVMEAARIKAEGQTLKALDFHYDGMEALHREKDWRQLWRYTDPYVKAALPRNLDDMPAVAVQINLSTPQRELLTAELPAVEAEVVEVKK